MSRFQVKTDGGVPKLDIETEEVVISFEQGGHSFLISTQSARALGYRVPTVEDSIRRLARDCLPRD